MATRKSPRKVTRAAHPLAGACLPQYGDRFPRHDFTRPQRFACPVIREHQRKSYRGVAALLVDCPNWLADIGMARAPDHHTRWRAFNALVGPGAIDSMFDLTLSGADGQARWAKARRLLGGVGGRSRPRSTPACSSRATRAATASNGSGSRGGRRRRNGGKPRGKRPPTAVGPR